MTLPKRYEGTLVGNYILAQNYADYAMGQFLDQLKSSGLWDDSVIVFTGTIRVYRYIPLMATRNR